MAADPLLAGRVNAIAEIAGLRLADLAMTLDREGLVSSALDGQIALNIGWGRLDEKLTYDFTYDVTMQNQAEGGAGEDHLLEIRATYQIAFLVPPEAEISEAELEAYGQHTVVLMLHPYLRELVNNLTGRAGLPPVVLAVLHGRAIVESVDQG